MAQPPKKSTTTPLGLAKQGIGGFAEATIADASLPGETYRPAIIYTIPTAVDAVRSIFNIGPKPGENDDFLSTSSKRIQAAQQRTNAFLGIDDPKNSLEMFARYGLPLAVPFAGAAGAVGKGVAVGTKLAAPSVAAKVSAAASKVSPNTARIAKKVTPAVVEVLAPVNLTTKSLKSTTALAGAAGSFGVGIGEVVDYLRPNADYKSIRETVLGMKDKTFIGEDGFEYTDLDAVDAEQMHLADSNDLNNMIVGTMMGVGAALGIRTLMNMHQARKIAAQRQEIASANTEGSPVPMTGKYFEKSDLLSPLEQIATKVADKNLPIYKAVEQGFGKQTARDVALQASLLSNNAQGSANMHFFKTGEVVLPNGRTKRYTAIGPLVEQAAIELGSVEKMKVLSDALISNTIIDSYARTGNLITDKTVNGKRITLADHQANVAAGRKDPIVSKYMDAINKSYRELLDYKLETGFLTPAMHKKLRAAHPNYVELAADIEKLNSPHKREDFSANRINAIIARTEEEGASIKAGGFSSPLATITDAWSQTIRAANMNAYRARLLEQLSSVPGSKALVKRVGKAYKQTDKVHTVYENGVPVDYIVKDPALSEAMNFFPRMAAGLLDQAREFGQLTTTGSVGSTVSGSWFTALKSPMFDTFTIAGNRPKGMTYGVLNEMLMAMSKGKLSTGSLDPTVFITAYAGAVRMLAEDMIGSVARAMADKLATTPDAPLYGLPRETVEKIQKALELAFENSTKSLMDRYGATSTAFFGSEDLAQPMSGMHSVAPNFARLQADYALEAVKAGTDNAARIGQEIIRNASTHVAANTMARLTTKVFHALNNGAKYSLFAANRKKFDDPALLAAIVRDASVDTARHGSSANVNQLTSMIMYFNLAIQTIYRMGQAFVRDPLTAATNYVGPIVSLAALYLVGNALDPKTLEANRNKTIEQKTASPQIFAGVEIPVEHINRMLWGPVVAVIDEVFGVNKGQLDLPAIEHLLPLLEDMMDSETFQRTIKGAAQFAVEGVSPIIINLEEGKPSGVFGNPVFDGFMALAGVNIEQSRIGGIITEPRDMAPTTDLNDPDRNDARLSAYVTNFITAVAGAAGQALAQMYNDFAGALGEGYTVMQSADVSASRYFDRLASSGGLIKPLSVATANNVLGPYEVKQATVDAEWLVLNDKVEGVEAQVQLYQQHMRGDMTSQSNTATLRAVPVKPLEGDALVVATIADMLTKDERYAFYTNRAKDLTKRARDIQHGFGVRIGDRNISLNELNVERRRIARERLSIVHEYEDLVRRETRNPDFTWDSVRP